MSILSIAASGMSAQNTNLENIAHNISNNATTSYKRRVTNFSDLCYNTMKNPSAFSGEDGNLPPLGLQVGAGVKVASISTIMSKGTPTATERPLDICIDGKGFFAVEQGDDIVYSRAGSLNTNANGVLINQDGLALRPQIIIPDGVKDINIDPNGTVSILRAGETTPEVLGQIELSCFVNEPGLESLGNNLYRSNETSGEAILNVPGEGGSGTIKQGYLEKSNVDILQEMIAMIAAQNAYELNSKALKAGEEILSIAAKLRA